MSHEEIRSEFERWISAPPREMSIDRLCDDERVVSWPGQYVDVTVELAWQAWVRSHQVTNDRAGISTGSLPPQPISFYLLNARSNFDKVMRAKPKKK